MGLLHDLTVAVLVAWVASEVVISLISFINRARGPSQGEDRLSFLAVGLSIMPTMWFVIITWTHRIFATGLGSFSALTPLLGYVGCLVASVGIAIRLVAVGTLRKQFTTTVAIVKDHVIVDTGLYRTIRHPAYLGLLASILGFGLASGNWFSLAVSAVLPITGILYRIHVEEGAMLRHFGPAYQVYASRTRRLLPGIY